MEKTDPVRLLQETEALGRSEEELATVRTVRKKTDNGCLEEVRRVVQLESRGSGTNNPSYWE